MRFLQVVSRKLTLWLIFAAILSGCSSTANVKEYSQNSTNDDFLLNEFSISTSPGMTLDLKSDVGSVKIKPGSGSQVTVKVYGDDETYKIVDDKAEKTSEGVEVTAKIKDEYKNNKEGWSLKLRFEIEVPSNYNVRVKTGGGSVSVENINGFVNINTGGGGISISNTTGSIDI